MWSGGPIRAFFCVTPGRESRRASALSRSLTDPREAAVSNHADVGAPAGAALLEPRAPPATLPRPVRFVLDRDEDRQRSSSLTILASSGRERFAPGPSFHSTAVRHGARRRLANAERAG